MRRLTWWCAYIVLMSLQSGCATTPAPYLSEDIRKQVLRSVGVVAIQAPPEVDLSELPTGIFENAAWGAAAGATLGFVAGTAIVITSCGLFAPSCPAAAAAFYGSTVLGAAAGAAGVDPAERIESIRSDLKSVLAWTNIQDALAAEIVRYARDHEIPGVSNYARETSGFHHAPHYSSDTDQTVASVLEVAVVTFKIRSTGLVSTYYTIEMTARARLVRVEDRAVLFDHAFFYTTESRKLAEWTENSGRPHRSALQRAVRTFAEYIAEEALLLSDSSVQAVSSSRPRPPHFAYSIYPEHPAHPHVYGLSKVDSLHPTLSWESVHVPDRRKTGEAPTSRPTYDLRLFRAHVFQTLRYDFGWSPGIWPRWAPSELIYSRSGIVTPYLTLDFPLAPCTRYFWTVRARWEENGLSTATDWGGIYDLPILGRPPWDIRRSTTGYPYVGLTNVQQSYFFRFMTPCGEGEKLKSEMDGQPAADREPAEPAVHQTKGEE